MGWSPSDGEQSCGANAALRAQAECGGCSLDQGELREGERTGVLRGIWSEHQQGKSFKNKGMIDCGNHGREGQGTGWRSDAGPWETEEAVDPGGRFCNVVAAAGAWPEWEARK